MQQKFLRHLAGKIVEMEALLTSAGAGDAGKIPSLDPTGRLDISFMPVGVGAEVSVIAASENLLAGDLVSLWNSSGIKVRKADASNNAKAADGFVLSSVTSPANATVYGISNKNTQLSGLTIGVEYWLSGSTPGGVVLAASIPTAAGSIIQMLGKSESATAMVFNHITYFELA